MGDGDQGLGVGEWAELAESGVLGYNGAVNRCPQSTSIEGP